MTKLQVFENKKMGTQGMKWRATSVGSIMQTHKKNLQSRRTYKLTNTTKQMKPLKETPLWPYMHILKTNVGNSWCHMVDNGVDDVSSYHWSKQYEHLLKLTCDHLGSCCHHMAGDGVDEMESYHWSKQYEHLRKLTRGTMLLATRQAMMLMTWRATIGPSSTSIFESLETVVFLFVCVLERLP